MKSLNKLSDPITRPMKDIELKANLKLHEPQFDIEKDMRVICAIDDRHASVPVIMNKLLKQSVKIPGSVLGMNPLELLETIQDAASFFKLLGIFTLDFARYDARTSASIKHFID